MTSYVNLSAEDRAQLINIPAYISLLAAEREGGMDDSERKAVIELTHIKTFSCDPKLSEFFAEVEKNFAPTIIELDRKLPKGWLQREAALLSELKRSETILEKLGEVFAAAMHHCMQSYKEHVSRAHCNVLEYFVFPIPIKGLTE